MRESKIVGALHKRILNLGGEYRKVRWEGRNFAPDKLVMLPGGRIYWVETKSTVGELTAGQLNEHLRMAKMGQTVLVISSLDAIDRYFPLP